jgi:uncharacterized protein (TIGR03437 family)
LLLHVVPGVKAPSVEEISNGATLQAGSIAPGMLFSIKGQNFLDGLGTDMPCVTDIIKQCFFSPLPLKRDLGGLQLLLDGSPTPILFAGRIQLNSGVSYDQINAMAPWSLTPGGPVPLVVKRKDISSPPLSVSVDVAAPGLFTTGASGSGQGSVTIGASSTIAGSADAIPSARAAQRGELIVIWATGLGEVMNPAESGYPAPDTVSVEDLKLIAPLTVLIGGVPAEPVFAGLSPEFPGLYQINVIVPRDVAAGDAVPVQVRIGSVVSQNDVTIAVSSEIAPAR